MQLAICVIVALAYFSHPFAHALDLDAIFDQVVAINKGFEDIFFLTSREVFRKDDTQPVNVSNG
jgi:hypothetical protein